MAVKKDCRFLIVIAIIGGKNKKDGALWITK